MSRLSLAVCVLVLPCGPLAAQRAPKLNRYGNPEKLTPTPTAAAITERDLQTRLYQFADDSMMGRQVGRIGNFKGTNYIAAELRRLKLEPAGDNDTYFQSLPYHIHEFTNHSRLTVDGNPLEWETDWVAVPGSRAPRPIVQAQVVFGGVEGDTTRQISAAEAAGRFVVLVPAASAARGRVGRAGRGAPETVGRPARGAFDPGTRSRFAGAVAVATVDLDSVNPGARALINIPGIATLSTIGAGRGGRGGRGAVAEVTDSVALLEQQIAQLMPQATIRLTRVAAVKLFGGRSLDKMLPGTAGGTVNAALDFIELPTDWARNVVAIIPGSDRRLRREYVAIGAHNDHIGISPTYVDHDSLKAFNDARNAMLIENNMVALTPEQLASIHVDMDSIREEHPRARRDSINNGADDDGSGSMGVLEIAEAIQGMKIKPKRSILFVWHTGEEAGLQGSRYFTHNPTVPMDSIVAQINIDMIGRGRAEDIPGGGPDYLAVVGSYFDSKDLGNLVTAVNEKEPKPLALDYKFDTTVTWSGYNNIYGRSDHYNYALQGVPIAFFFTGLHGDYHQRSDEPEFIDYAHYARITNFIRDVVVAVADGPRPRLNGTHPARPPRETPQQTPERGSARKSPRGAKPPKP